MRAAESAVRVEPITLAQVPEVASFLHKALNPRLSVEEWARAIVPPWPAVWSNFGFMLMYEGETVGANVAFYSQREVDGRPVRFCNLAAWCVLEEHRAHGIRLLRALLSQPGLQFTDLSPSGNVVAINERLHFQHLDTTTVLVPNLPRTARAVRVVSDLDEIARCLQGEQRRIFEDHRDAAAAIHVLLMDQARQCYVIARKDSRRRLRVFASLLHVSDPSVLAVAGPRLYAHLLLRHRALVTLVELRVVGEAPRMSWRLSRSRPKMFRSGDLSAESIDYLYSELTCVGW